MKPVLLHSYKMWVVLFIFILSPFTEANILCDVDLLKSKYIRNVNVFSCNDNHVFIKNIFMKRKTYISMIQSYEIPDSLLTSHRIGMILDTECQDWANVTNFSDPRIFKFPYAWFITTQDISSTISVMSTFPIDLDSDVSLILKSTGTTCLFYEVYNTGFFVNGKFVVQSIGYWNYSLYISRHPRINLNGVTLKAVIVITQNLVNETLRQYLQRPKPNTFDSVHKLKSFTILEYLSDLFNFRYELVRSNSWGYLRNGSFDGSVGALQRQEVELGSTPLFYRKDRAVFINYVSRTWQFRSCFIFRHPKHPKGYLSIYTRPLDITVWYSIMALLVLSSCFLCLTYKMIKSGEKDCSASLAILFVWSAVCQQGMTSNTNTMSTKIVVFVTFLFALTLYQYYNATVVSTLLREPPKNIRTLHDLMKSSLKIGIEDALYDKDYFKRTTDPIAIELYQKKVANGHKNFYPAERGLALAKHGGFAFHVDSSAAYYIMRRTFSERELCDIQEVALYPPQKMAVALRKGSPYREIVANGVNKMYEAGIMHRLKSIWDEPKPPCIKTPGSDIFAVSLLEFSMALIVLLLGIATSILLLAFEILRYKISAKKRVIEFLK